MNKRPRYALAFLVVLLTEICIALFVRDAFIRPYIGDVLAVVVVYFFVRIFKPEGWKWLLLYVFLFAVCIEIAQYFHLLQLLGLANNRIISIVLGGTFDWLDILCYGIGCLMIWGGSLLCCHQKCRNSNDNS